MKAANEPIRCKKMKGGHDKSRKLSGLNAVKINLYKSENLPLPLFAKEGYKSSLWQREVRRDFIDNVVIIMRLLINSPDGILT
jgi:hypothetical protein